MGRTSEPERVRQRHLDVQTLLRRPDEQRQVHIVLRVVEVDVRMHPPVGDRLDARDRLHRARSAEQVPDHPLRGVDLEPAWVKRS
eukprot:30964-Pelagococcus_subviridis.AAC.4